jgi:hypothetical protein
MLHKRSAVQKTAFYRDKQKLIKNSKGAGVVSLTRVKKFFGY